MRFGDEVDAHVARRQIEAGRDVGGNLTVEPNVPEFRAIDRIGGKVMPDHSLERRAALALRQLRQRGDEFVPRFRFFESSV